MLDYLVYGMIYIGSILMVYNIYSFVMYATYIRKSNIKQGSNIVNVPIILLIFFLLGYLAVAIFGDPDLIMAGILFGGSVFVYIIYHVLNNITGKIIESEKMEAELKAIEESTKAKYDFMASISHEMRTPMNVILGLDELALKNPDLQDETRTQLEKIGISGRYLLSLINNTLDMHDIETGRLNVCNDIFEINEILDEIDVMMDQLSGEKKQTYRMTKQELSGCYVGDKEMVKEVLMHILENAVKYTPEQGKIDFTIEEIKKKDNKCDLRFTISDNGIGMSEDFVPKAFELFSKEDSGFKSRYDGGGMGLAIAKAKCDLMNGEIKVISKRNVGSTFVVTIPFDIAEKKEEKKSQNTNLKGRMVLIVEDIDDNAEIVADLLELEDITSERAENGQKAVDMIMEKPENYYDAILMDLRMPVMDGLEATRKIRSLDRKDCKEIPIIALSANAHENDIENSLKAGMEAHLVKPIDVDKLYSTLNEYMKEKRS